MILGFKQHFPDKTPTSFKEKIWIGDKIHSIRAGNRWREGMSIQMAYGVRTKKYEQFNKDFTSLQTCVSVQKVEIKWFESSHWIEGQDVYNPKENLFALIKIDGRQISHYEMKRLSLHDGFPTLDTFFKWFNSYFTGQIIHWTDFKY